MSLAIIVHINHLGQMMLHNFCQENGVGEVTRDISLWSAEWDLIDPVLDGLQVLLIDVIGHLLLILLLHLHEGFWRDLLIKVLFLD